MFWQSAFKYEAKKSRHHYKGYIDLLLKIKEQKLDSTLPDLTMNSLSFPSFYSTALNTDKSQNYIKTSDIYSEAVYKGKSPSNEVVASTRSQVARTTTPQWILTFTTHAHITTMRHAG